MPVLEDMIVGFIPLKPLSGTCEAGGDEERVRLVTTWSIYPDKGIISRPLRNVMTFNFPFGDVIDLGIVKPRLSRWIRKSRDSVAFESEI